MYVCVCECVYTYTIDYSLITLFFLDWICKEEKGTEEVCFN